MLSVAPGKTLLGTMLGNALRRNANSNGAASGHVKLDGHTNGDGAKKRGKERKRMVAPLRGMGDVTARLERRLEERLGGRFRRGLRVEEVPGAPNVILATPAYAAARLLHSTAPELSRALREVKYTPIVSVTAFFPVGALTRPVKGEGLYCLGNNFICREHPLSQEN